MGQPVQDPLGAGHSMECKFYRRVALVLARNKSHLAACDGFFALDFDMP